VAAVLSTPTALDLLATTDSAMVAVLLLPAFVEPALTPGTPVLLAPPGLGAPLVVPSLAPPAPPAERQSVSADGSVKPQARRKQPGGVQASQARTQGHEICLNNHRICT
jgi:hypothetical protein